MMSTNVFFPITTIAALLVGIAFFTLAERKVLAIKPIPIKAWATFSLLMALPILIVAVQQIRLTHPAIL